MYRKIIRPLGFISLVLCCILYSCKEKDPAPTLEKNKVIVLSKSSLTIRMGEDAQIDLIEGQIESHKVTPSDVISLIYVPNDKKISLHPRRLGKCRVTFFNKDGVETVLNIEVVKRVLQPTALEYVSSYNIARGGISFDKTGFPKNTALFGWQEAKDRFSEIEIDGQRWHLPTFKEWVSVTSEPLNVVYFGKKDTLRNTYERVVINGVDVEGASEFFNTTVGTTYAVRFKNTNYCSAWKYSYERYKDRDHRFENKLVITARPVDPDMGISAETDLTQAEFWEEDSDLNKSIILPASGYIDTATSPGKVSKLGEDGFYWASDVDVSEGKAFPNCFYFNAMYIITSYYRRDPNNMFAVRLFKN